MAHHEGVRFSLRESAFPLRLLGELDRSVLVGRVLLAAFLTAGLLATLLRKVLGEILGA